MKIARTLLTYLLSGQSYISSLIWTRLSHNVQNTPTSWGPSCEKNLRVSLLFFCFFWRLMDVQVQTAAPSSRTSSSLLFRFFSFFFSFRFDSLSLALWLFRRGEKEETERIYMKNRTLGGKRAFRRIPRHLIRCLFDFFRWPVFHSFQRVSWMIFSIKEFWNYLKL